MEKRNYQNGKIYCIRNNVDKNIYVGHTTQLLSKRMEKHRSDFRKGKMSIPKLHSKMNEYGIENFYIEMLEKCPCEDIEELRAKEGEWIRKLGTLNTCIAGRSSQEYRADNKEQINNQQQEYYQDHKEEYYERNKKYREENPEKVKAYLKEYAETNKEKLQTYQCNYRQENRDKLNEWKTTKVECECGGRYTLCHKAEHFRSKKHQEFLNNNIENVSSIQEKTDDHQLETTNE